MRWIAKFMFSPLKIKSFSAPVGMNFCFLMKVVVPVFSGPCLEVYYLYNIKRKPLL